VTLVVVLLAASAQAVERRPLPLERPATAVEGGPVGYLGERLEVEHPGPGALAVPLLVLERPGLDSDLYALVGRVRYRIGHGQGYLELWSVFPGGGRYFSRTLAASGPMGALSGESDWRAFVLPFQNQPGQARPERLELNLVLAGQGQVALERLELVTFAPGEEPGAALGASWFGPAAGLAGGLLGVLGAVLGFLLSRARARRFVLACLGGMAVVGALGILLGGLAWLRGFAGEAVFALLLLGAICLGLGAGLFGVARRRYAGAGARRSQVRSPA
jgi:hypothetical protein